MNVGVSYYKIYFQGRIYEKARTQTRFRIPEGVDKSVHPFTVRAYDKAGNYEEIQNPVIVR